MPLEGGISGFIQQQEISMDRAEIIAKLEDGAGGDIWYDPFLYAHTEWEIDSAERTRGEIEAVQQAMREAAQLLKGEEA